MSFAVATGHALTSEAAAEVLRDGGTAVDAAVAAAAMAFVVEPVLAGPMGGGFLMLAEAGRAPRVIDAFVETPSRALPEGELDLATITVDFGTETQDFHIGAGTVAVPCLMPALFEAHARLGRMPLPQLFAPAVSAARHGHAQHERMAYIAGLVAPILTSHPEVEALYAPGGKIPPAGTLVSNPALADVLEVGALEGARFYTEGEIGQGLAGLPGSQVSVDELKAARWISRAPLTLSRSGAEVALNPPPSLGGVQVALALSALPHRPEPALLAHAFAEIAAIRKRMDMDGAPADAGRALAPELVAVLEKTLAGHRASIRGTTHISVIAGDGSGVGLTMSNGTGSGRLIPGTGIVPNNMLGEEDLVPGGPVAWRAGQRLASMMCPMAIRRRDGALTILGSGGSARIRSALSNVALGLLDFELSVEDAVAAPRLHYDGGRLSFEIGADEARRAQLLAAFPEARAWAEPNMFFGGVHTAHRAANGSVLAVGDARRAGVGLTG
ncbi:gamma-glutamyltransferase [Oceanibium sediminis]|uniref:gamma-glutamyltransferase n=1 Tax=Oceanibium sediminis TaxID=2026339 RepID=UPI000DD4B98D|nr:gamma-glutamyltransferase [Oceanibium sediminis]